MKKISVSVALGFFFFNGVVAQSKEIAYTMDDRDRLIRVEEQIKALESKMDAKFEAMDAKFEAMDDKFAALHSEMNSRFEAMDDKINKLYTLMYFVLGGVFGLIGFVIYDRRTALTPVTRDNRKLKEILYELAKTNPELREILNKAAL